ncbi:MAG: hypothetical protein CFH34_01395 [Alphaproteobacteria bacterium MarineAlpha9_Bin4]|nr:hypothetical protein [Pelagibacterales bacterium]PPR25530.1 MAG: hypothetical protein CFH34_01395 [Alphaproteobacteria bacterium MarineAlpha9_Bin4]|tara:strand:- start:1222 stop:1866 length:645 start_codon:yes stop_codon:yes gene_type:complete
MILYDYPKAPNPMRLRLFIYEKNIKIKSIFVDLKKHENLKPKYLKINSWGTLPFLKVNKKIIKETIAICRYLETKYPTPNLFGKSALEQGLIEMLRRKVEIDGFNSVGEAFRNSTKAFKNRAIPGPQKIKQIPDLVKRGTYRTNLFFDFLEQHFKKNRYVAANRFSVADIDAYVTYNFAKWIKIDGTKKRNNFKSWVKKIEKRKSIQTYSNLFS